MSLQHSDAVPSETAVAQPDVSKKRSLIASTVGNILEWYEWSAYAVFAPFIAAAMFNPADRVSALLSTLAVFAVGFLMRPLGGIVFGRVADRRGRKFVLITTMLMMAGGSLLIGLMPSYADVGVWASVILLLARIAQGFAHGGESATANSYVAEIAPPNRRGLWGSIVFVAIFAGSVLAYTVGGTVTAVLEENAVAAWGWRIPFILGAFLALAALYLRKGMEESEVFHEENGNERVIELAPLPRKQIVRAILLMIAMTSGITATHYTWTSYASTYAITQQGMSAGAAYWSSVAAQVIALVSLPFWGRLSDKIGRRPMMIGFAVLMILLQLPLGGRRVGGPRDRRHPGRSALRYPLRELPDPGAHTGHRLRLLGVRGRVRRHGAVPQRPTHRAGRRVDVEHLHHDPVRLHRGGGVAHAGNQGHRPQRRVAIYHFPKSPAPLTPLPSGVPSGTQSTPTGSPERPVGGLLPRRNACVADQFRHGLLRRVS